MLRRSAQAGVPGMSAPESRTPPRIGTCGPTLPNARGPRRVGWAREPQPASRNAPPASRNAPPATCEPQPVLLGVGAGTMPGVRTGLCRGKRFDGRGRS